MKQTPRATVAVFAAAVCLPFAGHADDLPKLREGLWEVRGQSVENPGDKRREFTYRLCRDHAYDKAAYALLKNVQGCTTAIKKLGGGKFSSASTCTVAGVTVVSNGLSIYASDSTHSESRATYTPAFNGKTEETVTQDQQYVGKCLVGMRPGDTISPDGLIRHHDG
jgi:hypothetical protein